MCSRYIKKHIDLSEKPKIIKKIKKLKHPSPSQSWSGSPAEKSRKAPRKRSSTQKLATVLSRSEKDTRPKLKCCGPDPSLPHLKYGLFPKLCSKGKYRILSSEMQFDATPMKVSRVGTTKEGETSTASASPLVVVRTHGAHLTRRLTRAASTHLDIKPRDK